MKTAIKLLALVAMLSVGTEVSAQGFLKKLEKAAKQGKRVVSIPVKNIDEAIEIRDWLQSLEFFIPSNGLDGELKIYLDRKRGE
jgi:hypothetical protein